MRAFAWSRRAPALLDSVRAAGAGRRLLAVAVTLAVGMLAISTAEAQRATPTPSPSPGGFFLFRQKQKPAASSVNSKQDPAKIDHSIYDSMTAENSHVIVSLGKQRAYLMVGEQIAIDSPISSGRAGHTTPTGSFHVEEKDRNHMSNIYGNYVDRNGRVVRSGISSKIDAAPAGTHYVGAPMLWFMRLTGEGVGMHVGILPGYAASHGCVRMPSDIAPLFYDKVKLGTPVQIKGD